jgi:hypothetical protein
MIEDLPLVSIIIPVFNGANYMRQAIDSALSQTYGAIEIIVVNDGSDDNGQTDAIAKSYGKKIRYLVKENGGCASALNLAIANMRGEYFSWLSHDDVYLTEKISHQIEIISTLPNKDTILYGGWEVIDSNSNLISTVRPEKVQPIDKLGIPLFPLLRGLLHGCSMLIPHRYFQEIGVFDEGLPSTQDYDLWYKFLRKVPIHYDSRILIRSRVHPEQGTHKITKHIDECNALWSGMLRSLTEAEMCQMDDTPYRFLMRTYQFLSNTPYLQATKLAHSMAEQSLENTLVSVIIPFRNRIDWTIEAVKSVQGQTHTKLEIILIDDASTDDLKPLILLSKEDSRINLIQITASGPAHARNVGLSVAQGIYVAFLDSDDLFLPSKIKDQLNYLEFNDLKIGHTSYQRIDEEGNILDLVDSGAFKGCVFPGIIASCPIATPTVMGLTATLKDVGFPEQFDLGEDLCAWINITRIALLGGLDVPLTKVRIGKESASRNQAKQLKGRLNLTQYILNDPELSKYGKEIRQLLQRTRWLVPNINGPKLAISKGMSIHKGESILKKGLRFIHQNGVRAGLRRIGLLRDRS